MLAAVSVLAALAACRPVRGAEAAAAEAPWRLELADGAVAAIQPPIVQARGGVRFTSGELEVSADAAVYDDDRRVVEFYGAVEARRPGQVLRGQAARVDLRTGQVTVEQALARFEAAGVEGPVFMEAARMEGGEAEVRASGAVLTTCPLPLDRAHYRVTVRRLEVRPGVEVAAYHAVFWESGVPLFYWPYLHFSLKNPRAGRFVPPEVGYGSREGWYVRTRFPYMGPGDAYGYVGVDYFQRLGPGLELYQALYDDTRSWLAAYLGGTLRGPDGLPPDVRAGVEGQVAAGGGGLSLSAEASRQASAAEVLYVGRADAHGAIPQWGLAVDSRARGSLPATGDLSSLQGLAEGSLRLEPPGDGPWKLTAEGRWDLHRAPGQPEGRAWDLAASLVRRLGRAEVALSASHTTHPDLFDDPEAAPEWRSVTALPELSARLPLVERGALTGSLQVSAGRYAEVRPGPSGGTALEQAEAGRGLASLQLQAGPVSLGAWQLQAGASLDAAAYSAGLRQTALQGTASARWPAGRWAYVQGAYRLEAPLGAGRSPFVFDRAEYRETVTLTGVAGEGRPVRAALSATYDLAQEQWGLATGSLRARAGGLEAALTAGYQLGERRWEGVVAQAGWKGAAGRAQVAARYLPEQRAFDEVAAAVALEAGERAGMQLAGRYDPVAQRLEQADATLHWRVLPDWVLVAQGSWDLRLGGLAEASVGLALDQDCRAILLRYDPVRRQVALAYQIKAFPGTMVALGQAQPGSLAEEGPWQALLERLQKPLTP